MGDHVAKSAHRDGRTKVFLYPVEVVEHAVCHIVIASYNLLPVASGEVHSSGADVVDVASADSAVPARWGDPDGDMADVMDLAVLEFDAC